VPTRFPNFEEEIVDQYALAMAAGRSDGHIRHTRAVVIEFARTLTLPPWEATFTDACCAAQISSSIAVGRKDCCTPRSAATPAGLGLGCGRCRGA
jgi:hypothetical protein